MNNIYIVTGQTGEWSDHREWLVKAFHNEVEAEDFVNFLEFKLNQFPSIDSRWRTLNDGAEVYKEMRVYDPNFSEDYTGTGYYIQKVELDDGGNDE